MRTLIKFTLFVLILSWSISAYSQSNRVVIIQSEESDYLDVTLNSIYGAGNYEKYYYYYFGLPFFDFTTIDSTICTILLIEEPSTSFEFNEFYTFYQSIFEDWVEEGGHLLVSSSYNEDSSYEMGFGNVNFITTNFAFCSDAECFVIADSTHSIFNGPNLPAYSPIYDFSYTYIQSLDVDTLIIDTEGQHIALCEKAWGEGNVVFSAGLNLAQTPSYYLGSNIFSYLSPCLISPVDIGIINIEIPSTKCSYSENEIIKVVVRNYGLTEQSNFQIAYSIDGIDSIVELITDTIPPGYERYFTFVTTANLSEDISHNIYSWSVVEGDTNHTNDTASKQITRLLPITSTGFPSYLCPNVEAYYAIPEYPTGIWSGEGITDLINGIINTTLLIPGESIAINYQYSVPVAYLQETITYALRDSISPNYLHFNDIGSSKVDIGFTFKYFGNIYDSVYIGANGILTFENGYDFGLPEFIEATNNSIAVCEADLYQQAGGKLYYETIGTAPNREFIVAYNEIPFWFPSTEYVNVQCILHESTSQIEFQIESIDINVYGSHFVLQGFCNSDLSQLYYTTTNEEPWSYSINDTAFIFNPISCDTVVTQNIFINDDYEFNLPNDTVKCDIEGILLEIPEGDFIFNWSNGDTTNITNILESGIFWVTASNSTCIYNDSISVLIEAPPMVEIETVGSLPDLQTGSATAIVTGGTTPYEYVWSDGQTTPTITNLGPGTYTVTVFNSLGCSSEATATVGIINSVNDISDLFSIFPNPTNSVINIKVNTELTGGIAYIYSIEGSLCTSKTLNDIYTIINVDVLPSGLYFILINSKNKLITNFFEIR
ncbi:MAG: T9SS type A sorting domain-containing protein [Chitinophagaceae bacterium]